MSDSRRIFSNKVEPASFLVNTQARYFGTEEPSPVLEGIIGLYLPILSASEPLQHSTQYGGRRLEPRAPVRSCEPPGAQYVIYLPRAAEGSDG